MISLFNFLREKFSSMKSKPTSQMILARTAIFIFFLNYDKYDKNQSYVTVQLLQLCQSQGGIE